MHVTSPNHNAYLGPPPQRGYGPRALVSRAAAAVGGMMSAAAAAVAPSYFKTSRSAAELAYGNTVDYAEPGLAEHKVRAGLPGCKGRLGWAAAASPRSGFTLACVPSALPRPLPAQGAKHLEEHWHAGKDGLRPEEEEEEQERLRELAEHQVCSWQPPSPAPNQPPASRCSSPAWRCPPLTHAYRCCVWPAWQLPPPNTLPVLALCQPKPKRRLPAASLPTAGQQGHRAARLRGDVSDRRRRHREGRRRAAGDMRSTLGRQGCPR